MDAVFELANLWGKEGRRNEAITLLVKNLFTYPSEKMHVKLGQLYLLEQDYSKAHEHFNSALALNPNSSLAKRGQQDTDKCIHGIHSDEDRDEWGEVESIE
jgi:tetratricopeptide (TPR) repeat protein